MADPSNSFDNLDRAGRVTAQIVRRPRFAVYAALGAAVALSWFLLLAVAARNAAMAPGSSGPGGELLLLLPVVPLPSFLDRFFQLCLLPVTIKGSIAWRLAALSSMWFLMSLATMLPSAAPMIRTYCEIADTARAEGKATVHPLVLVAGYIAIWSIASVG